MSIKKSIKSKMALSFAYNRILHKNYSFFERRAGGRGARGRSLQGGENKKISSEKIGADFAGSEQNIRLLVALSHRVQT